MKGQTTLKPDKIYTVSQITQLIKLELESVFPLLWIEGEVSNFRPAPSGHLYFTLKDEESQIRAVMFRFEAKKVPFELKNGLQVICYGCLNVYAPKGEYQVKVELLEPKGKGALQLAFEQLKEKLKAEGLFDAKFKKKIPLLPKKVGVITSPRGAAIIDIIKTLERRFARLHVLIYPVRVQGEGAASEIVDGINYMGALPDIDVIIVGRGGGSMEDLWAFNEEKVARAIFHCPVPIISAVGHEIDFTIADFVADIRASTPSAAAEMVIEKEQSFLEKIMNMEKRILFGQRYFLQEKKELISSFIHHQIFQNFKVRLLNLEQKVDDLEIRALNIIRNEQQAIAEIKSKMTLLQEKIWNTMKRSHKEYLAKWEKLSIKLHSLSPLNILKKGYALCWEGDGTKLIQTIEDVEIDKEVVISFYRGEFISLVKDIDRAKSIKSRIEKEKE